MSGERVNLTIQDFSSCDFYCGDKLRIKTAATVIDSSGVTIPGTYNTPYGTVPNSLKEGAVVIEVFSNALAFWKQTSCSSTYTWDNKTVISLGAGSGIVTTFVSSTGGNSGLTPATPGSAPGSAVLNDTLIERFDDFTNYWTYNGSTWVLKFQDSNSEDYNTYFRSNTSYDPPATSADPPNPSGSNPSTNLQLHDTYISKYNTQTVFYTYNGSAWVENFRLNNSPTSTITGLVSTDASNWLTLGTDSKLFVTPSASNGLSVTSGNLRLGAASAGTTAADFTANRFLYLGTFDLSFGGSFATHSTTPLLYLDGSTGYIGIGTPSPATALEIKKSSQSSPLTNGAVILLNDSYATSAARRWTIGNGTSNTGNLTFHVSTDNATHPSVPTVVLASNGRVGINAPAGSPAAALHVITNGSLGSTGDVTAILQGLSSQTGDFLQIKDSSGNVLTAVNASGNLAVRRTTATAYIHLAAGTATAGTAPIKLTTGTPLTTTEDGVFEYHTSHLYFTIGSTRYQLDQQLAAANNGVSVSAGVLQLGTTSAGTGAADFSANRFLYQASFNLSIGGTFGTHSTYPIFYLTGATGRLGLGGTTSPQATLDVVSATGLGTTANDTDGILLSTLAAATAGNQQISAPVRMRGYGWKTTTTAASQPVDFQYYVLPVQGSTAPSGNWILHSNVNSAGYSNKLVYSTAGDLSLGTNTTPTAKLDVKGTADSVLLVQSSTTTQLLKVFGSLIEVGATAVPLNIYSSKTTIGFSFTASTSGEKGIYISGGATAAATLSSVLNAILVEPTLTSSAGSQTLNAFKINATFVDVNSATKNIVELLNAGTQRLSFLHDGKLLLSASVSALASNDYIAAITGTISGVNSISAVTNGVYVTATVSAGTGSSQKVNGVHFKQTLTSDVTSHTMTGLLVDTTFTYTNNPTRLIADLKVAGTSMFAVTDDGRIYGTALHNNAGSKTGVTNQYILSGTYTPTLTNSTNVAASSISKDWCWTRVGNVVHVSGILNIDVTSATLSEITASLPIASSGTSQVGGGTIGDIYGSAGSIGINPGSPATAGIQFSAVNTGNHAHAVVFMYLIE